MLLLMMMMMMLQLVDSFLCFAIARCRSRGVVHHLQGQALLPLPWRQR
jgi:hypothetical protein